MKRAALIALLAIAAKIAYELIRRQRSPGSLPEGAPYEPAPVPDTPSTPEVPATPASTSAPATPSVPAMPQRGGVPATTQQADVPATTESLSPVAETVPSPRDDLTLVRGIGPVYAGKLQKLGITTFAALESTDTEALAGNLEVPPAMVANWQNQARGLRS